jgi:putative hydrolase of the HAD superfamily
MAKAEESKVKTSVGRPRRRGILLELDNIAVNGRELYFNALKKILAEKDIELTPVLFSKHCLQLPVRQYIQNLLNVVGKSRLSPEKLTVEIYTGIKSAFSDDSLKLLPGVQKLLKLAAGKGDKIGMVSGFDADTARKLVARVGLGDLGPNLYPCYFEEKGCPGADAWLMLARNMNIVPAQSVAIASGGASCRAALSAGMRCVVVPDKFTAFHDFSGADFVFDSLTNEAIDAVFKLLERN